MTVTTTARLAPPTRDTASAPTAALQFATNVVHRRARVDAVPVDFPHVGLRAK